MTSRIRVRVRPLGMAVLALLLIAGTARGQRPGLTLHAARELARQTSPDLAAARAAVEAAAARERQTGAFLNPSISYSREQTSGDGSSTSQNIASLDQRLEVGGQRGARVTAARLRRESAEARLELAGRDLDLEVARAYIAVSTAARRAELAANAARQFSQAAEIMTRRLQEGDVSGYEVRRTRLEAVRYAALAAEAQLIARDARFRFNQLLRRTTDTTLVALQPAADSIVSLRLPADSLVALALTRAGVLRIAELDVRAAEAEATSASREVIPTPTFSAGLKNEQTGDARLSGFVAGISLPLPLWDRRSGATEAARAEARRLSAEQNGLRRQVQRSVELTVAAVRSADQQQASLGAQLGAEANAALQAAELAFAEGEITLLEWLDAVRAYQEAESAYTNILAESYTQRATLERLLGVTLIQ